MMFRRRRRPVSTYIIAILDFILPASYHQSPDLDLQRRGRILVAMNVCFFFVAAFYGAVMILMDRYPLASVLVLLSGCVLVLINLFLVIATRIPALPGILLCFELLAIQGYQAYNDLGLKDPVLLWAAVIPLLAALMVSARFGVVFAGIVTGTFAFFFLLDQQDYLFPGYTGENEYGLFLFLCASGVALLLGFLGWLYEDQTLKQLRLANEDLRAEGDVLQRSFLQRERVIDHLTDGFFTVDSASRFTDLSPRAEQLARRPRHELIGCNAWRYFAQQIGPGFARIRELCEPATEGAEPVTFELLYPRLDRWFRVHVLPSDEGAAVYFTDITEQRTREQQLVEEVEELRRQNSG